MGVRQFVTDSKKLQQGDEYLQSAKCFSAVCFGDVMYGTKSPHLCEAFLLCKERMIKMRKYLVKGVRDSSSDYEKRITGHLKINKEVRAYIFSMM